jgi:hypothetical protein
LEIFGLADEQKDWADADGAEGMAITVMVTAVLGPSHPPLVAWLT